MRQPKASKLLHCNSADLLSGNWSRRHAHRQTNSVPWSPAAQRHRAPSPRHHRSFGWAIGRSEPVSLLIGLRVVVRGEKRFFFGFLRRSTANHLLFIIPVERGATASRVMATLENYLESTIWPHPDTRSRGRVSKFFWDMEVHQGILSNFHGDDLEEQTNPVEIILASHQFSREFTAAYNHPGALRASAAFLSATDEHAALYENIQPRMALVMIEKLNREAVFQLAVADFVLLVVVTFILAGVWRSWDKAMNACGQTAAFMAVLHGAVYFVFD